MRNLLLASTSTTHGTNYLDHCAGQVRELFADAHDVLFVPFAIHDHEAYEQKAAERFRELGLALRSIHRSQDPVKAVAEASGIFIGGGNTFRLLKRLSDRRLIEPIRERVSGGLPYLGASAGSNVAGLTIKTTNDILIVYPPTFDALQLVPFNLNPHYLDPDPNSTHMGETRETRIKEFHEENEPPVVGLREGAMLRIEGDSVKLLGERGARLFQRHQEPIEFEPGASLDFLCVV